MSQQLEALRKGNEIRKRNADIKRQIRNGELTVAEALYEHEIGSMKVAQLIQAHKWFGEVKTRKLLAFIGASRALRVDDLTNRQRDLLAQAMEGR
jgi:hypothetical protein